MIKSEVSVLARKKTMYMNDSAEEKAFYVVNGKSADKNGNAYSMDL